MIIGAKYFALLEDLLLLPFPMTGRARDANAAPRPYQSGQLPLSATKKNKDDLELDAAGHKATSVKEGWRMEREQVRSG